MHGPEPRRQVGPGPTHVGRLDVWLPPLQKCLPRHWGTCCPHHGRVGRGNLMTGTCGEDAAGNVGPL